MVKPLSFIPNQWSPCLQTLEGHDHHSPVVSVTFSHDGTKIISGSLDGTVQLWDAVTGTFLKTFALAGHYGSVALIAVSFDDSMIVSSSANGVKDIMRVWDMVTGALLQILESHSVILSLACSTTKHRVVSSSDSKVIQIWDILDGIILRRLYRHTSKVASIAFSINGEWIVSSGHNHTV